MSSQTWDRFNRRGGISQKFYGKTIESIFVNIDDLDLRRIWRMVDKRKHRSDEFWLNIIVDKL